MLQSPVRTSLVAQLVEILAREITAGKFQGELPGEHPLCERLGVSRSTLRAALDLLQKRGYVRARRGCRREILKGGRPPRRRRTAAPRGVTILSGSPIARLTRRSLVIRTQIMHRLLQLGHACQHLVDRRFAVGSPDGVLRRIVAGSPDHLWVLGSCSAATQAWFCTRGIPAFVEGQLHPGIRLPAFDVDYRSVGRHAASHLLARGHRNVALVFNSPSAAGHLTTEAGFLGAQAGGGSAGGRVSVHRFALRREDVHRGVEELFRLRPVPTAIFVTNEEMAIAIYSCLVRRGVRVPGDLSIVAGVSGPMLECLTPDFTRYQTDFAVEVRRICRLVEMCATQEAISPTEHFLMPDFHAGETVRSLV